MIFLVECPACRNRCVQDESDFNPGGPHHGLRAARRAPIDVARLRSAAILAMAGIHVLVTTVYLGLRALRYGTIMSYADHH
jgi:hypothetical protein